MSKTYTYTFLAKDLMSSKLAKIAGYGKKMGDDVEDANDKVERSSRRASGSLNNLTKITGRWIAIAASAQTFKAITQLGFDAETSRLKFETLLGSTERANQMIADLNKFANVTPFENQDLKDNAELLLNFGIAGNKVLPTLKMIGDVSGGNKEKLKSLSLAYAQVSSTGKLMGQDLLQMINAGFNPLQIISDKTGRSMAALKDDMSKGRIGADQVEEAFRIATSEGGRFYGMMDKISKSGAGKLSTFLGTLKSKVADWSESNLTPILGRIFDFGTKIVNNFGKVTSALKPISDAIKSVSVSIGGTTGVLNALQNTVSFILPLIEMFSFGVGFLIENFRIFLPVLAATIIAQKLYALSQLAAASGTSIFTIATKSLNAAMKANPIGFVIGLIIGLVGVITYAYQKVGWFRGSIMAVWESIKGFGSAIKEYIIDRFKQMLSGLAGIGKALYQLFVQGEWKKAFETGKEAMKNITGIGVGNGQKLVDNFKATGAKAGAAYYKGISEAEANKLSGGILGKITGSKTANLNAETIKGNNVTPDGNLPDGLGKGIDSITGGGQRQTNITVSFDKLVENYTVHTETFEQGMDESLDTFKSMLLRVLNSANQMQTSYS